MFVVVVGWILLFCGFFFSLTKTQVFKTDKFQPNWQVTRKEYGEGLEQEHKQKIVSREREEPSLRHRWKWVVHQQGSEEDKWLLVMQITR